MKKREHRQVDAFMRALAEGTRLAGTLPTAAQVRMRMLGRGRLARSRRAMRPIQVMEAISIGLGLAGAAVALYLVVPGVRTGETVSGPETLSLLGPSLSGGSVLLATFALVAIVGVAVVVTAFSDA